MNISDMKILDYLELKHIEEELDIVLIDKPRDEFEESKIEFWEKLLKKSESPKVLASYFMPMKKFNKSNYEQN